ncbi:hypothetical protein BJ170DRAFT_370828 [Xylariales sp. AK1849]|nr:hypothetical protein BJ170DRAFT_370828 [Xylariales sp. AK1849]
MQPLPNSLVICCAIMSFSQGVSLLLSAPQATLILSDCRPQCGTSRSRRLLLRARSLHCKQKIQLLEPSLGSDTPSGFLLENGTHVRRQ